LGGNIVYKLIIAGVGVLAVVLLAMGCGGGGSDEATAQVNKAEFYKQARSICAKTLKEIVAVSEAAKTNAASYRKMPPLLEHEAEELEALSGPEAVEAKVDPLIANVMKASQLVEQEGEAAATGPTVEAYKEEAFRLHLGTC
jgi:hypothetical protein